MKISGHVTYVELSGGFWGIVSSEGDQYQPVAPIPANLQKEGIKVTAKVSPASGMSIFMWGTQVNVDSIKAQ